MNASLLLTVITILLIPPSAQAAKLYKIVGEDGKVTFSQYPPQADEQKDVKIEDIKVRGNDSMTRITEEFGKTYCGEIQLPSNNRLGGTSKYYIQNVLKSQKRWQKSLDNLALQVKRNAERNSSLASRNKKYSSSYQSQLKRDSGFQSQYERNTSRIRDLRCAINWAEKKETQIDNLSSQDQHEKARLSSIYAKLEAKLDRTCGQQPRLDPTDSSNEYKRRQWYDCSKSHVRDMKKVRRKINRL